MHLLKDQQMELHQEIFLITEVSFPVVDVGDSLCCGIDCSRSCSWGPHDAVDDELYSAVHK